MPQIVEFKDSEIEFPDSMSADQIAAKMQELFPTPRQQKKQALLAEQAQEARIGEVTQNRFDFLNALAPIVEPFTASGMLNQPSRALGMPDPFQPGVGVVTPEVAKQAAELSPAYQLLRLASPSKEGVAEGVKELTGRTLSGFTTPESIVTLPAAAGTGTGPALVRTAFAAEMGKHLPEQVAHAAQVLQDPSATTAEKVVAVGEPTIAAGMIAGIAKHAYDRPTARIVTQEPVPQRTPFPPEATPEEAALFAQEFRVPKEPVVKEQAPPPKEAPEAAGEVKLAEAASPAPAPQPAVTPEAVTSQAVGMGGAVPSEFQQTPKTATGIKNATVDAERTSRGLPPAMQVARRGFGTVWDESMAAIDRDPGLPDRLIAELRENPRALTDAEDATLLHRQIDLQNEYGKATRDLAQAFDDGRLADVEAEKLRVQGLSDQLLDLYNINKRVGTETGRGLNARKMMAYEDFSLARMELEKRAANEGAPLTDAQRTEIQSLHDRIAETQRKYDEYVAKTEAAERERTIKELVEKAPQPQINPYIIQVAEKIVGGLDKRADAARVRLREKLARTSAGVDPTILVDLAEIGASHLGHVGLDFAKWSARMIEDIGEWSREHLEEVFKRSQQLIDTEVLSKVPDASKREGVRRTVTKQDKKEAGDAIGQAIRDKVAAGEQGEITGLVQKLARTFVELGIKDRDALIDAVHQELQAHIPDITRRETMDAISGYGKYKQLTKDEISVQLRDLKGQMQQVSKLEDMQAGQAPRKTGLERRTPSDKERQLIKQVNELKKKAGFVVTDPARQLRSALDAVKTRLQHQITDLSLQISNKQKITPEKRSIQYDAEANALKAQRDALKAEYDEIFGRPGLSDEQRISMATKAVERSIAEYERRIRERDIGPRPRESKTPPSAALDALKAQREALQEQLKEMRDLANPKKTPEERALQGLKARLKRNSADLMDKLARGDFSKKARRQIELDAEAIDLKAANEKVKAEYQKGLQQDRLSKRSIPRKIWDGIKKTRGAIVNIKSSFDFSAPRQALTAILSQVGRLMIPLEIARTPEGKLRPSFINPAQTVKSAATHFQRMFQAWASPTMAGRIEKRIQGRRNAENGADKAMGIEYTDLESPSFTRYEENAHSVLDEWAALPFKTGNLPKTIATAGPKAGAKMVRMSNRAFITFLNSIRADLVDTQLRIHFKDRPPTDVELKTLGNAINVATGRGKLSPITARVASEVLWAPKLLASRVQTLTGQPLWGGAPLKGSGRARAIIAQEYARIIASGYLLWTVSRLFDEKDETDLTSSDFGKIVRGDTRIDPWGGLQQVTTLGARIGTGETKNVKGKTLKADLGDLLQNFARSKLRPDVGVLWDAWDIAFDKVRAGHPETFGEAGRELFTPLPLQDITTIMKEHGFTEGMIIEALQQFGAGVSHYEQKAQR